MGVACSGNKALRVGLGIKLAVLMLHRVTEDFYLPRLLSDITGQTVVPFGDGVVVTMDTVFGCETCEELFVGKRYVCM